MRARMVGGHDVNGGLRVLKIANCQVLFDKHPQLKWHKQAARIQCHGAAKGDRKTSLRRSERQML